MFRCAARLDIVSRGRENEQSVASFSFSKKKKYKLTLTPNLIFSSKLLVYVKISLVSGKKSQS